MCADNLSRKRSIAFSRTRPKRDLGSFVATILSKILADVSNLVNDLSLEGREEIWAGFVSPLEVVEEQPVASYEVARRSEFRFPGLTDSVLASMFNDFLVVSNHGRMVNLLRDRQVTALKWVEVLELSE